jgi:tetratricopeptide (TPR) repeat protein
VARIQKDAQDALASDPQVALELYRRAAELQPEEPTYAMGQAMALDQLERTTEAAQLLATLAGKVKEQPALLAEVVMDQADLALRLQNLDEARRYLEQVLSLAPSPELTRSAQIKLASLDSPSRLRTVELFFRARREELRLLYLARALEQAPKDPYFNYLLGRRLQQAGDPALAVEYLTQALTSGGPELPEAIRREALKLEVESSYLAGDCGAVRHEVGALPGFGPAFKAAAAEWVARCDFEDAAFHGPLVPRQAFR